MPRASTKVFKKRRGVLIKEDVIKVMMVVVKAILLFQRTLLMKKIVLMVQSFVLMKLNHLPVREKLQQEKPVNTVWQKLFVKPLMKMMEKGTFAVAVDGSWQKRGFSSKNGLVTVTSVDTGKVIDVEVFQNIVFVRTKPTSSKFTNTNHAKAMLSATIAVFFTVAPTGRNPYMGRARFELRTSVTINEETTPENNKQKKLYVFL
ncbi:hypothetical protein TNCV_989751 [Trichonephila clavipes]|nr:hypothetical protein TNCV_989751 [Trichonephila clavipes]